MTFGTDTGSQTDPMVVEPPQIITQTTTTIIKTETTPKQNTVP